MYNFILNISTISNYFINNLLALIIFSYFSYKNIKNHHIYYRGDNMNIIPTVSNIYNNQEKVMDIYSLLLEERIIILNGEIDDNLAMNIVAQLLYLYNKNSTKDISLYINSPGGSISAGMAIYDTMNFIKCDVSTIGIGMCASMGAFLLSSGKKGKRKI